MVGIEHYQEVAHKFSFIPKHNLQSNSGLGVTLFHASKVDNKEGTHGLWPVSRVGGNQWASLVIEVGYSQRLKFIRMGAEWRLINSGGKTILMTITCLILLSEFMSYYSASMRRDFSLCEYPTSIAAEAQWSPSRVSGLSPGVPFLLPTLVTWNNVAPNPGFGQGLCSRIEEILRAIP